jgi:hypothetical protein
MGTVEPFSVSCFLKKLQVTSEISMFDLLLMVCQQSSRFMMAGDGVKQRDVLEEVTINIYFSLNAIVWFS